jgi:hypothetical protein
MVESDEKDVIAAIVNAAKGGDMLAAKIIIDRLHAPARGEPVSLPEMNDAKTIEQRCEVVIAAVADGRVTPEEAERILRVLDLTTKARAFDSLEDRIRQLEAVAGAKRVLVGVESKRLPTPPEDELL